jgi:hypothetical protein
MAKTYCPRCFKDTTEGAHTCSGRSPHAGSVEYERMVDAGERAALDSEMAAGQRYSEENAVVTLRRMVEGSPSTVDFTVSNRDARYLLAHVDRLSRAEKELHRMRNAELARKMADSNATIRESLSGKPCPTCTKPLPETSL